MDSRNTSQAQPTPAWVWLLVIGGFGLIFWYYVPEHGGPKPKPPAAFRPWIWVAIVFGVAILVILIQVAWQLFRNFDRVVRG